MEHFYNSIHGYFDFQDIYTAAVQAAPQNGAHFVEVGSWKGTSSAYMAVEIANSGKNILFDCVDTWEGTAMEHDHDTHVQNNTLYEHFLNNMKPVEGYYTPLRKTSVEAASLYQDGSLDFVFIDAGHTYEDCSADIHAWMPKLKPSGLFAGHDYGAAEGVKRAVDELIPNFIILGNSWIYDPIDNK